MRPVPVLLPGNMCDARLWSGSDGALAAALAGHSLVEPLYADCTLDGDIAAMTRRALAQTPGPLLAIGFSMGAIVAVEMAVRAPERIAGLVLIGYNATADLPERAAHRPVQQAEVLAGGLERVLVEELKPNYLSAANRGDAALLDLLRAMGLGLGPDVFVRQSEALRLREDRRPALAGLGCPVLYMCGLEDRLCPPVWHRQWMDMTPDSQLAIVAGAGHMLPLEAPGPFSATISQWLIAKEIA